MPSFKTIVFAVAAAFVAAAQADYIIDPLTVPLSKRQSWCADEKRTCPILCQQTPPGTTLINDCDPLQLTYGCICGNGQQPNVSEFSLTLPYHVCQEWGNQCVTACKSDNTCASACRQDNPCGAQNPQRANKTSTTTRPAASATQSGDVIYTGVLGGPGSSAPRFEVGRLYGLAVVLGTLFAGFAVML